MGFSCGIVGLPNVGKSTLFNALTSSSLAQTANYPFCTIEPNVGRVAIPDETLEHLARVAKSEKVVPTYLDFVDIAGLVKGANEGEGLGNKFLDHIRQVDAIVHVLRCFDSNDVNHTEANIDPVRDAEIIETELLLSDIALVAQKLEVAEKKAKSGEKEILEEVELLSRLSAALNEGKPARSLDFKEDDTKFLKIIRPLTLKPIMYVCNVEETAVVSGNKYTSQVGDYIQGSGAMVINCSAQIEEEVAQLDDEKEKAEFLASIGMENTGLARLIQSGYSLLNLITYYTAGPKEARAWTIPGGTLAPQAAGIIHSDFERGFICAETISADIFLSEGGESAAKSNGKMRQEGKDYIVQAQDVILFRFNV